MNVRNQLLNLTTAILFFLDDGGTAFASIPRGLTESCVPLHSPELRAYLFGEYEKIYSAVPNIYAYRDLLHVLEAKANDSAVPRRSLDPRIAADGPRFHPETIYLNLANETGDAVEISARGWNVRSAKPFYFRASSESRALPAPEADGPALDSLFETLTGLPVEVRQPCLDWMLASLRPTGPYPILVLKGASGSGKSTLGRLLRQTLDPSRDPLPTLPNTARRLRAHAEKNRILAFDHVTHISRQLSEVLCTTAKPIVLTMPDRAKLDPELTSRATVVELPEIQPEQRRTEAELFATFHQLHAQILGALCTRTSQALANLTEINPGVLPRNADAAAWTTASTPLSVEQSPLPLHLPSIPTQLSIIPHHPMTGDGDGHRIRSASPSHSPASRRPSDLPRDFTVRFGLPVRDGLQVLPNTPLERRRLNIQRQRLAQRPPGKMLDDGPRRRPWSFFNHHRRSKFPHQRVTQFRV
jgi:hypothetical protein